MTDICFFDDPSNGSSISKKWREMTATGVMARRFEFHFTIHEVSCMMQLTMQISSCAFHYAVLHVCDRS